MGGLKRKKVLTLLSVRYMLSKNGACAGQLKALFTGIQTWHQLSKRLNYSDTWFIEGLIPYWAHHLPEHKRLRTALYGRDRVLRDTTNKYRYSVRLRHWDKRKAHIKAREIAAALTAVLIRTGRWL